jgi:hypothetical protein
LYKAFLEVGQQNMKKCHVHRGASAPTDKICGNESKIGMTNQNYRFVQ